MRPQSRQANSAAILVQQVLNHLAVVWSRELSCSVAISRKRHAKSHNYGTARQPKSCCAWLLVEWPGVPLARHYFTWPLFSQGPVVRKPINLIQDKPKLLFHVFNFLVQVSFAYFCFSRLTSSHVHFCRISALNSIWEQRNKLLG